MASDTVEILSEKPLHSLERVLKAKLLQHPFTKVYVLLIIVIHVGFVIVGSYLSLKKNNFHRYIPYILLYLPVICLSISALLLSKQFKKLNNRVEIKFKNQDIKKKVTLECRFISKALPVPVIAAFIIIVTAVVPIFGDEDTFMPSELIIREYSFPRHSGVFICIAFAISSLPLMYPMLSGVYSVMMIKIQVYLILDKLMGFSEGFSHLKEDSLIDNELYQKAVYDRLTNCIKDHVKLIRFLRKSIDYSKFGVILAPVVSVMPVAALYFILNDISPRNNFRMVVILVSFAFYLGIMCHIGQTAEDVTNELHRFVAETPWESWNKKNRQALLIFLINTKPRQISAYNLVTLNNHSLLLTIYRCFYSLIMVLL